MSQWMTVAEIAEAKLPGLPETKRGVQMLAQSEGWDTHPAFVRPRAGRGGGLEYDIRILPTIARMELLKDEFTIGAEPPAATRTDAAPGVSLTDRAARERDARLAIVVAFERFATGLPRLRHMAHLQVFQDKYNARTLHIEPWVLELVPRVSKRSIDRWRAARKEGATTALAVDRGQARKGTGVLDRANEGRVLQFALALIAHQPHLSAKEVRRQCRHQFGDFVEVGGKEVAMPPIRTFQHALKRLKQENRVLLTKLTNPDLYRSTMKPSGVGALRHRDEPNALWQIDASPVDAICTDGRHTVYVCVDIATRRLVITVSKTPRASAVALLMRKAILALGVPETVKTDNGSDFVARDTKRLMDALGIEVEVSDAYSPEQKGHVERAIRTFQQSFAPTLNGYVGRSVEQRKAIEARKSFAQRRGESEAEAFGVSHSAAELQGYIDQWLELDYQHASHGGLDGASPFQAAAASANPVRRVDERALDLLLMPVAGTNGRRKTTKFGVQIDKFFYAAPELEVGEFVFVRQDPLDVGVVKVFRADGAEFICDAYCPELAGISAATLHEARREIEADRLRERSRQLKADMREIGKVPLIEKALEVARRDVPNVVALPKREVTHTTPQIDAALVAMDAVPRQTKAEANALFQAQLVAETQAPSNVQPLRAQETEHQRYRRALRIEQMLSAGEAVEERDLGWLQGYQTGSEYRTMKTMHADFGDQVLG